MSDKDPDIPQSALRRTARLAALPVAFAGRSSVAVGKRLVGKPAGAVLLEVQQRTADQMFRVLGELKGGAMKFGQALSVFEAAIPPELAEPYRQALTKLQDSAPAMSITRVEKVMATQFGEDWADLFQDFDAVPAAAASIGQVHRAIWNDGREVAVKIQYPGAAKALTSDLKQISRMATVMGSFMPAIDVKPLVEELTIRVKEELNYSLEAESQNAFADAFADDERFVIPRAIEYTDQVLISEWLDSPHSIAHLITHGKPKERDRIGALYAEFLLAGPAKAGLMHADPHPGNFRIMSDGRLGIVDFGAVAHLPDGMPMPIGKMLKAAVAEDYESVVDGLIEEGFIKNPENIEVETIAEYLSPFVAPARDEYFTFSRDWMREQATRVSKPDLAGLKTAMQLNLPREYLLVHRVWSGAIGVLSQIGATAPYRQLLLDYLPGFDD